MTNADGSVIIQADMNVSDAEKKLKKLEDSINDLDKELSKAGASNEIGKSLDEAKKSAGELRRTLSNMDKEKYNPYTPGYSAEAMEYIERYAEGLNSSSDAANELKNALERAKKEVKDLESQGKWFGDEEYDDAVLKLERIKGDIKSYKSELVSPTKPANPFGLDTISGKIKEAENELRALTNQGKSFGDESFDSAYKKLVQLKAELKNYQAELAKTPEQRRKEEEIAAALVEKLRIVQEKERAAAEEVQRLKEITENAVVSNQRIVDLNQKLVELKARQAELEKAGVGLGYSEYDGIVRKISSINDELKKYQSSVTKSAQKTKPLKNMFSQFGRDLLNGVQAGVKKIPGMLKSVFSKKNASGYGNLLASGFKSLLKYAVGIRSLWIMITKLRSALVDGFKNLAQYSGETNRSISMVQSALTQLKNSLATAFSPILTVVSPIVTQFINLLTRAADAMARLTASLTGQKTYIRATAVQEDYAGSLEETANAAKDAQRNLSGLDEITAWQSGGTGTSGGGTAASDMFETVEIEPSSFASWGEAFSAMLDTIVNKGLPKLKSSFSSFSKWFNRMSQNLYEMFTFPGVYEKVSDLGTGIGEAFNEMVNQIDWTALGGAIGSGFILALAFFTNLIYTFDWVNFGKSLSDAINEAIRNIDWINVGRVLWSVFKISIETLSGFLLNLDMKDFARSASDIVIGFFNSMSDTISAVKWEKLGEQIVTFLVNIKWDKVASSVFQAIGIAFGAATEFLWGLIRSAWQEVVDWWKEKMTDDGKLTMESFLSGVDETLESIDTWIKDHIVNPFLDGVKRAFGIAPGSSASKKFDEIGRALMEGLKWGVIFTVFPVVGTFAALWKAIKAVFSTDWFKNVCNGMAGYLENTINSMIKGINWMITQLNRIKVNIPDWVPIVGGNSFGINIPYLGNVKIPRLAEGAVIPPNREFMAILGDQKRGTNIEAPLSTIEQAVENVWRRHARGGSYTFTAQINRRTLFQEVIEEAKMIQMQTGKNPFAFE